MNISDEKLVAFMDGELSAAEMASLENTVSTSPELARRLELLCGADEKIRQGFAAFDARPIRADTKDLINNAANAADKENVGAGDNVVAFKAKPQLNTGATSSIWMRQAIAASIALVIGFGGGAFVFPGSGQTETSSTNNIYQTAGLVDNKSPLFSVLETSQSASTVQLEGYSNVSATPVSTFQTYDNDYCREFDVQSSGSTSRNIACRNGGAWTIVASVLHNNKSPDAGVNFITASDGTPQLLDAVVLQLIEGDILDKEDEAKLLSNSWR